MIDEFFVDLGSWGLFQYKGGILPSIGIAIMKISLTAVL